MVAVSATSIAETTYVGQLGRDGDALYRARGAVLAQAQRYATVLFSGISLVWLANTMISVMRGTGNMHVPSASTLAVALLQIILGASGRGAVGLDAVLRGRARPRAVQAASSATQ